MSETTANITADNGVITRARRVKLCLASSDATKPLPAITHIAFGDGGVDGDGNPVAPSEAQTALIHETARYAIDNVTYPVETTARYTVTIPRDDMTGDTINEAALVDADGDFAAIKTMYNKRKDAGVAFTFEFDDEF